MAVPLWTGLFADYQLQHVSMHQALSCFPLLCFPSNHRYVIQRVQLHRAFVTISLSFPSCVQKVQKNPGESRDEKRSVMELRVCQPILMIPVFFAARALRL